MRRLLLTTILLLLSAVSVAEETILISEVTDATYQAFLDQYSDTCQPHVKRWVAATALAAQRFNEGKYSEAEMLIERYVKPGSAERPSGSAAIMFSSDCTDTDLVFTIKQSIALEPMISSVQCMVRIQEADTEWILGKDSFDPENIESINKTLRYIDNAIYAIDDVMATGTCRFLDPTFKQNILDTQSEWKKVKKQIITILEMPRD